MARLQALASSGVPAAPPVRACAACMPAAPLGLKQIISLPSRNRASPSPCFDMSHQAHSNPSKKPKLSGADALNSVAKGKQPKSAAAAPAPAAAAAPAAAPFTGVVVAAVPFPPGVIAAVAVPPIPVDADSAPPTGGMKE